MQNRQNTSLEPVSTVETKGTTGANCDQPLRPALLEIKDNVGADGDRLNVFGDDGGKGATVPKKDQKGQKAKAAAQPPKPKK